MPFQRMTQEEAEAGKALDIPFISIAETEPELTVMEVTEKTILRLTQDEIEYIESINATTITKPNPEDVQKFIEARDVIKKEKLKESRKKFFARGFRPGNITKAERLRRQTLKAIEKEEKELLDDASNDSKEWLSPDRCHCGLPLSSGGNCPKCDRYSADYTEKASTSGNSFHERLDWAIVNGFYGDTY